MIVYLTWRFSLALAEAAQLSLRVRTWFATVATLVAAFAPLYDVVEEMRVTGGYIEAFALMLWLLWCAFRLTQRWNQQPSRRELTWRWIGLGFLVGLGFWIDPMVVYACVAIALWIGGYFVLEWIKRGKQTGVSTRKALGTEMLFCLFALPAAIVGFTPGLIWGAQNNWANIAYIFHNGTPVPGNRLHTILKVGKVYLTCLAPRAIGGALPTQPDVTPANPHILTFALVIVGCSFVLCASGIGLSFFLQHQLLTCIRQLTFLPMIFFICTSAIFCVSSISIGAIYSGCGPVDYVGRYVVALVVCLPFFVAAVCVVPFMISQEQRGQLPVQDRTDTQAPASLRSPSSSWETWSQIGLLILLVLYFATQAVAYIQADSRYTFQPTGCVAENPTTVTPLISYMESADIHYAWASSWIGNRITFLTNGAIIATDWPGRLPANGLLVLHQKRASIFLLARHNDEHPAFLQLLNANHVIYKVARFYSEPGIDVLLVTPLNRTVSPLDPAFASQLKTILIGCL